MGSRGKCLAVTLVQLMAGSANWYRWTLAEITVIWINLHGSKCVPIQITPDLRTLGYSVKQKGFPDPPEPELYNIYSIMGCSSTTSSDCVLPLRTGFKIRHYVRLTFLAIIQQ